MRACRALLNIASLPSLRRQLQTRGALVAAVESQAASTDLRVKDAAKGCLLQVRAWASAHEHTSI